jgi:hypothetical protein
MLKMKKKLYVLVNRDKILKDYTVEVSEIKPPFPLFVPVAVGVVKRTKSKSTALRVAKETAKKLRQDKYDVEIILENMRK